MNRQQAIAKAEMYRAGDRTIDADGIERKHDSISAAKRHTREKVGLGHCVAQKKGEDLFVVRRQQIADRIAAEKAEAERLEAEAKAAAEAEVQAA